MEKVMLRNEQKEENTWDLRKIFEDDDIFYKELENVESKIEKIVQYKGRLLSDSKTLLEYFTLSDEIERMLDKIMTYANRKYDEDLSNINSQELMGKSEKVYNEYLTSSSFVTPELLSSDFKEIDKLLKECEELEKYRLIIERIFRMKDHTLSDKEESLISSLQLALSSSEKTSEIIRNSELQFGNIKDENGNLVKLTDENYSVFIRSSNRDVRRDAFNMMYNSYEKYKETLTETFQGYIAGLSTINKIRGFKSSLEASLFYNRIPVQVYHNLVNTVRSRLDVVKSYFSLKKEVLKLEDFSLYDTYVQMNKNSDKKYTLDDAKRIVLEVVKVFGDDYKSVIEEAFNERWIDYYPNKSKRGGAYSAGSYDTVPYILLNYQGTYNDVSTLIHELGHSMHTYYSNKNNDYGYNYYKIFVAEVASTVNELLLNYYLLEHSNDIEEKKSILNNMMDLFKGTIFRQTMFSEFEDYAVKTYEEKGVLTNKDLCDKYYELNKDYFGDDVIVNDVIRYEWLRVPHFYYNFYVYQYATGLAAACYIVNRIKNNEDGAVSDYLDFLKTGDSMDPVEELKIAGVDMTDSTVINKAIDMFESIIKEYQSLL